MGPIPGPTHHRDLTRLRRPPLIQGPDLMVIRRVIQPLRFLVGTTRTISRGLAARALYHLSPRGESWTCAVYASPAHTRHENLRQRNRATPKAQGDGTLYQTFMSTGPEHPRL